MAKHLLHNGAKLCSCTPEEFRKCFPQLWELTPPGASERALLQKAAQLQERQVSPTVEQFRVDYPELCSCLDSVAPSAQLEFVNTLSSVLSKRVTQLSSVVTEDKQRVFDRQISEERTKHEDILKQLESHHKQEVYKMKEEHDQRIESLLMVQPMPYLEKPVEEWARNEVVQWVKNHCPGYEPVAFEEGLITGRELVMLTKADFELLGVPKGPAKTIWRELEKLTVTASSLYLAPKSFYCSNYKALLKKHQEVPVYQDEVFLYLRRFIDFYCLQKGIHPQEGLDFFHSIQQEALEKHKDFHHAVGICARLWTSAKVLNKTELCSMLCEVLREDSAPALEAALPIIRGISYVTPSQRERIEWPEDNLLYRGAGIPTKERVLFTEGKKYRCPMFLATSTKRKVGEMFCNRAVQRKIDAILYILHLDEREGTKCFHVNYVGTSTMKQSNIDGEDEFLFVPYSVFTIRSITWRDDPSVGNPHIIHLDVAVDNEQESEFLPLIPWH